MITAVRWVFRTLEAKDNDENGADEEGERIEEFVNLQRLSVVQN
jgi:hypothetical protein